MGTIDIVATAPGKIIPSGRTKIIQPFETGVVRAIHVRDGQSVKAGDVLIELDPTMNEAELGHLQERSRRRRSSMSRGCARRWRAAPIRSSDFHPPEGASPTLIEMQRQFLISQTAEQHAKLAAIERQQAQKEAERATIAATIAKLEATIPLLQQRVDIRKTLYDKELGSKLSYLTELQDLVEQQQDLARPEEPLPRSRCGGRSAHRNPRTDRGRVPPHAVRRAGQGRAEGWRAWPRT